MDVLDSLLTGYIQVCAEFPDKRKGGAATYSMSDIGLSAFSLFFMQSESFLAYKRGLEERRKNSNCRTLFGMVKIPTDKLIGRNVRALRTHRNRQLKQARHALMHGQALRQKHIRAKLRFNPYDPLGLDLRC